ncbi:B12-binding domain-containing radical SAM protein [uncultured Acetatifactor sp.]|uniref:B12-binding domain-containing radical SAM protein n=1 Tax=uncultured Acetatifactor sp. TaxID=1671927 RepID=UPI00262D1FAB|nr:DUF4080 domain-containing protein [uncultured Acetatifactor sp.]
MDFKFLLVAINAKYIHSNPAVYSLRACAGEKLRRHVELAEYTINQPMAEILADIYARRPDAMGFSCYIWNWRLVRELLGELPKLLPDAAIWLGGPEVSYDADVILREYPQVAGIMVGEGEATFRELLDYYVKGARAARSEGEEPVAEAGSVGEGEEPVAEAGRVDMESRDEAAEGSAVAECPCAAEEGKGRRKAGPALGLADIPGLCLPTGYTPCRPLTDLSAIPFLYDDLAPFENRILYYETSRGCPFRCSYCLSSIDKAVRIRDMGLVEEELQFFLDHRVRQVKFIDRTFNCSHAHAMAVWTYLLEHDNGVTNFHFEISADILREEEIELLSRFRPGLAQMEIGVQTVNPRTLEAIRRTMDIERLESAVAAIRRGGNVHLHLDLIAGLPYEGYESFGKSFDWVYRLRPHQLQLGFLKVLKGSEMWERAQEYGIRYLEQPPYEVLCTDWLSYGEVMRLKGVEEMVELYYNSGQFVHTLNFLENAFPGPFAMYEALADFYREEGHLAMSPARASRYQVLLDFAGRRDSRRREVYRELLTYDLYLRENAKSRPGFAPDISAWKEAARSFYREEEQRRRYLPDYEGFDSRQLGRMTHLEPFAYPVWDIDRMAAGYGAFGAGESMGHTFVLFDYRSRSPLNHEALARPIHGGLDSATGCCTDL